MIWSVVAARAGTCRSTVFIVGKTLAIKFEALRLATVAWFVLAFRFGVFLRFLIFWFYVVRLAAILRWLDVFF